MKHFLLLLFLTLSLWANATITVTAPAAGVTLSACGYMTISYSSSTYVAEGTAALYNNGVLVTTWAAGETSASFFTLPSVAGSNFQIKVYDQYNTSNYGWSGVFSISAPVVSALSIYDNEFVLGWMVPTGPYRIDVSQGDPNFGTWNGTTGILPSYNNSTGGGNEAYVFSLQPGTNYYSRVRSVNGTCTSPNSNVVQVLTLPAAPIPVVSQITSNSFSLSWPAVNSAAQYSVDYSTNNTFPTSSTTTTIVTTNSFNSPANLTSGGTYYARVESKNSSGYSYYSSTLTIKICFPTPVAVAATNTAATSFQANWNSVPGASAYIVTLNSSAYPQTSAIYETIQNLQPLTTYSYMVQSVASNGCVSPYSNLIQVTTLACPELPPPTNLSVATVTQVSATATWASVTNASNYNVTLTSLNLYPTISKTGITSTSYTFNAVLGPSTTYYLTVTATGNGCTSASSNNVNFTTLAMVAPTLTSTVPTQDYLCSDEYTLSWNSVLGATSYHLQTKTSSGWVDYTSPQTGTSYKESGIGCGQIIDYRVVASSAYHTVYSSEYDVPTEACDPSCLGGRIAAATPNKSQTQSSGDNVSEVDELTAYPNPATDRITVAIPWVAKQDTPVTIADMYGRNLGTINLKQGEWRTEISTLGFSSGVYIVNVGSVNLKNVVKVLVIK